MERRVFLLSLTGMAGCATFRTAPLRRGAGYLLRQQSEDGGWHSRRYGLMSSGQSLTGLVINALLDSGEAVPSPVLRRAAEFLRRHTSVDGAVGLADRIAADYPNYATALAVQVAVRAKPEGWQEWTHQMLSYLRLQQYAEANGWQPADPAYGAWGVGGERRYAPYAGHLDISMTRRVLEAFAAAGTPPRDPVFQKASIFLSRLQNPDGGFFFSTVVSDANKAGRTQSGFRSYGTATADGILALRAIRSPEADLRAKNALHWLSANQSPTGVPGFDPAEPWNEGLRYYHAAAVAPLGVESPLSHLQRGDGSWANPEPLVKEDDPLIATSFSIQSLGAHR